jgi:hypothetical protein
MYFPPSLKDVLQPMFDDYSAQEFVRRLAKSIEQEKAREPVDLECVLEVVLRSGDVIHASRISAEGTSALRIEGLRGEDRCVMFCNHASLQLICSFRKPDVTQQRPPIGFYVAGEEVSSGVAEQ